MDEIEIRKAINEISQMPEEIEKGLDGIHKDLFNIIKDSEESCKEN